MSRKPWSATFIAVGLALSLAAAGCGGGGGGGGGDGGGSGDRTVSLKGSFTGGAHARNLWFFRALERLVPSAHALDPQAVQKVYVFYPSGSYSVTDVVNGAFTIDVSVEGPTGVIFVGAGNQHLGYLSLGQGLDTLPMNMVDDSVTTIDLSALSSAAQVISPAHNPVGTEILLTEDEKLALGRCDNLFAAVVRSPDANGNGTLDFLEGRFFRAQVGFGVEAGEFNVAVGRTVTATPRSPAGITDFSLGLIAKDTPANAPAFVHFSGPAGSGLDNKQSQGRMERDGTYLYGTGYYKISAIPPAGDYTVSYNTETLTFAIEDQSDAPERVVLPVPTVTLNDNNTIQRISWTYRSGGTGAALDPAAIIDSVIIQIDGDGPACANYPQQGRIYDTPNLPATTTSHVLACQNLAWSNVHRISTAYNDLYGNHYVVTWRYPGR